MKTTPELSNPITDGDGYRDMETLIGVRVAGLRNTPLFVTDADPAVLWSLYLNNLWPDAHRQFYNCHACRRFVQRYGGLVTIDPVSGDQRSALFHTPEAFPTAFRAAATELRSAAERAEVVGVFMQDKAEWGVTPDKSGWTHLSGQHRAFKTPLSSADQLAAAKTEDHLILERSLNDYPRAVVAEAVRVLEADVLSRSEKQAALARWFLGVHDAVAAQWPRRRDNLLWAFAATAPAGWCHVHANVIHTLLDDVAAGMPFTDVSRRWAEKMHPLQYLRPTAAPKAGAIDRAEEIFRKLGAESAMRRRFATLDDVLVKLWTPRAVDSAAPAGVFGHLRARPVVGPITLTLPPQTVTWEKFRRDVLPTAVGLEYLTPMAGVVGPFFGLSTAADPASVPILQWDGLPGRPRNPAGWYFYHGGSTAHDWGLPANAWVKVTAAFNAPPTWQEPEKFAHFGKTVMFSLERAVDNRATTNPNLCLFPEMLKAEYHEVRSVIEGFNKTRAIENYELGTANGVAFAAGSRKPLTIRVNGRDIFVIDRWE